MNQDHRVFRIVSILLQYPSVEWKEQLDEFMDETKLISNPEIQKQILKFLDFVNITSFEDLCFDYVSTFDFSERTTLYLTYSVFKDNRERGPALVKLRQEFLSVGAVLNSDELPDYLPLILEFAAITKPENSRKILGLHLRSIERLHLELEAINSIYSQLLTASIIAIKNLLRNADVSQAKERGII